MDEIKLKRGREEVVFKKIKNLFAVKLNQGRASSQKTLEASCGPLKYEAEHIDGVAPAHMDIFVSREDKNLESIMETLRKSPASDVITHMYTLDDTQGSAMVPMGTMTLQFAPTVDKSARESLLDRYGLEIVEGLDTLPQGYAVRLTQTSTLNPLKIAAELQGSEEILVAEPDFSFRIAYKQAPSDTLYQEQWHLNNTGGFGLKTGADVKAEGAWAISRGTRDIIVCVTDDGFDLSHPDFLGEDKVVSPRDFGDRDFDPNPVNEEDNHGTACAGVAIAEENGSGVVGLAPRCAFMPVRTSPWLSDLSIEELFRYAMKKNADVISCSWSAEAWNFPLTTRMDAIIHQVAVEGRRNGKGCVILFAAGNEDRPLNGKKAGQISQQGFALHPDVIAVAASNSLDRRSNYSNHGPEIALCAPSSGSPGRRVVTTDRLGAKGYSSDDFTRGFGGTSSSTPLAAGLAALILSVNPDLTSAEVKRIMMDSADKIDLENGNYTDGHSPQYGHGRINAQRALKLLADPESTPGLPETLYMEHRVTRPIPDLEKVEDTIPFPLDVIIQNIEVSVNITHTYRGDLKLTLFSPQGKEMVLLTNTGESDPDLIRHFRSSNEPELFEPVKGVSAKGDWRLQVEDLAGGDVGVLNNWGLTISFTKNT